MNGKAPHWMTLLAKSERGDRDSKPQIDGKMPTGISGSLYRNGPGLFERGPDRVRHLLDGDGLIQRLSFDRGLVRYQNRFVQTEKFLAEAAVNRKLVATWTTRRPGGFLRNIGGRVVQSQAGVTVRPVMGTLLARDEVGPSYEIDPKTLDTLRSVSFGETLEGVGMKAHSKIDTETGEWVTAGLKVGRRMKIHVASFDSDLRLKREFSFASPRQVYFHDFFLSENYLIFILHPCYFSLIPFLSGFASLTDSLRWRGDDPTIVAIVSRSGGTPRFFEAPSSFMWHGLNAWEDRSMIAVDFVGYDKPDHFIGRNALMYTLMRGQLGDAGQPGKIRRYTIDFIQGTLNEEILDHENHEFPMLDSRCAMHRHRFGYFSWNGLGGINSGLKRLDYDSGASNSFAFDDETHVGEPVFVPDPLGTLDDGWLISQCLDGFSERTFFAVFRTASLSDGPIVRIWLDHHVPISFHGTWQAA